MTLSLWLVVFVSLLSCLGILATQKNYNQSLREEIQQGNLKSKKIIGPAIFVETQNQIPPEERAKKSSEQIIRLIEDTMGTSTSPLSLLKGLPGFLTAIENLNAQEVKLLQAELKSYFKTKGRDYAKIAALLHKTLTSLSLEQDPESFLARKRRDNGIGPHQEVALAALVRSQPESAMKWLNDAEMSDKNRAKLQKSIINQMLLENSEASIEGLREYGFPWDIKEWRPQTAAPFIDLSPEHLERLEQAFHQAENGKEKTTLGQTIVQSLFATDLSKAREKAGELGFTTSDLDPIFQQASYQELTHPVQLLDWFKETEDIKLDYVGGTVGSWASRDLKAAAEWLDSQPPSDFKDEAIEGYAAVAFNTDRATAMEWFGQIQNTEKRQKRIASYLKSWKHFDSIGAQSWIEKNNDKSDSK